MAVQKTDVQWKDPGPGVSAHRLEPHSEDSASYGKVALILANLMLEMQPNLLYGSNIKLKQ